MPNSVLDSITKNPWIKKLTDGLSKILTPIKTMFGTVAENAGAFAKTVGKILKPLGFLFSAFDGIMAAINTEGDFLDKLGAFTSAFIGDFVGAPLDLLKDITAWVLEKFGFDILKYSDEDKPDYDVWVLRDIDAFCDIWLWIAKIGNPDFQYNMVHVNEPAINIGGYGFFD